MTSLLTELTAAAFQGLYETPPWGGLLQRLRRRAGADHAVLAVPARNGDLRRMAHILAAPEGVRELERTGAADFFETDWEGGSARLLAEGEPQSPDTLFGLGEAPRQAFYLDLLRREGIADLRQLRVQEPSGVNALVTVTRRHGVLEPGVDAMLRAIAPVLRGVLQVYVASERDRFAAAINADTVRRLQFGWLALDRSGRVLDCDALGRHVLTSSGVLSARADGAVAARPAALEKQIYAALAKVAADPSARPRAVVLRRDPWLDMLILPARGRSLSTMTERAAIAYVHSDSWGQQDRHEQLAELFSLSPREARLALAVSRGLSLAEAAAEYGLAIGTARAYSKSIYAKTGARGQPDLVRIVMSSVLAMPPES